MKKRIDDIGVVTVDPWGEVRMRAMSARQITELAKEFGNGTLSNDDAMTYYVKLIAESVIDENNELILPSETDRQEFCENSFRSIQKLGTAILQFNGLTGDVEKN